MDLALLASAAALLGKLLFRCFIHTCTYNFGTEEDIRHSLAVLACLALEIGFKAAHPID